MSEQVRSFLGQLGLSATDEELLVRLITTPPAGTIAQGEWEGANLPQVSLLGCIALAPQIHQHSQAFHTLLTYLSQHTGLLSPFDMGRFFHMRGYASWQLERVLYTAFFSLNQSISLLLSCDQESSSFYLARVHNTYGQILHQQGQLYGALQEYEEALRILEKLDDEVALAHVLGGLGRLCLDFGAHQVAREYLLRDLDIVERTSPEMTRLQTQLLSHLGACELELGALSQAEVFYQRSKSLAEADDNVLGLAFALLGLGRVALAHKEAEQALDLVEEARALMVNEERALPVRFEKALRGLCFRLEGESLQLQGALQASIDAYAQARDCFSGSKLTSPVEKADLLRGYAAAVAGMGDMQRSAHLLREALSYLDSTAADRFREEVESELRKCSRDSWLLHSAGRFIGQKHIEFLLQETGRGGFRGERKEVCVMFADLRGFSAISQQFAAHELIELLNDFLAHMTRSVEVFGGFVDKFIGDAVMAVFSLPLPQDDDTERALQSALLMQVELARFRRKMPLGMPQLKVGVGLHKGPVVAGLIGSPQKRSYTVIGDAVNTSSRLEGMTKTLGASVLVSESIREGLSEPSRYLFRPLGTYIPKGQNKAVKVFDVHGEDDGSPAARALREESARFVQAYTLMTERHFAKAAEAFSSLALDTAHTMRASGYELVLSHCRRWLEQPPADEWCGAIPLSMK